MRGRTNAVSSTAEYVNGQIAVSPDMGQYLFAFDTDSGAMVEKFGIDGATAHDPVDYKIPRNSLAFSYISGPLNGGPISAAGIELIYRYDISGNRLVAVYRITGDFSITNLYSLE